jgi:hypothetical protein
MLCTSTLLLAPLLMVALDQASGAAARSPGTQPPHLGGIARPAASAPRGATRKPIHATLRLDLDAAVRLTLDEGGAPRMRAPDIILLSSRLIPLRIYVGSPSGRPSRIRSSVRPRGDSARAGPRAWCRWRPSSAPAGCSAPSSRTSSTPATVAHFPYHEPLHWMHIVVCPLYMLSSKPSLKKSIPFLNGIAAELHV